MIGIVLLLRYGEEPSVGPDFLISIYLNAVDAKAAGAHLRTVERRQGRVQRAAERVVARLAR